MIKCRSVNIDDNLLNSLSNWTKNNATVDGNTVNFSGSGAYVKDDRYNNSKLLNVFTTRHIVVKVVLTIDFQTDTNVLLTPLHQPEKAVILSGSGKVELTTSLSNGSTNFGVKLSSDSGSITINNIEMKIKSVYGITSFFVNNNMVFNTEDLNVYDLQIKEKYMIDKQNHWYSKNIILNEISLAEIEGSSLYLPNEEPKVEQIYRKTKGVIPIGLEIPFQEKWEQISHKGIFLIPVKDSVNICDILSGEFDQGDMNDFHFVKFTTSNPSKVLLVARKRLMLFNKQVFLFSTQPVQRFYIGTLETQSEYRQGGLKDIKFILKEQIR